MLTNMRHELRARVPTSFRFVEIVRQCSAQLCTECRAFQNSPFMQGVRKTEVVALPAHFASEAMIGEQDLCWTFTCDRDEKRKKTDPSFKPVDCPMGSFDENLLEGSIFCDSSLQDDDFSSPKAHEFDRCTPMHLFGKSHVYSISATRAHAAWQVCCQASTTTRPAALVAPSRLQ